MADANGNLAREVQGPAPGGIGAEVQGAAVNTGQPSSSGHRIETEYMGFHDYLTGATGNQSPTQTRRETGPPTYRGSPSPDCIPEGAYL